MKGFDRVLWEAMRPELLKKKVARPEEFVEGIEDLVVCHCDQIPMWLRLGATKQLYTKTEVHSKKRKLHEAKKRGEVQAAGNEEGGQVMVVEAEDGMAQLRQLGDGGADRFRVTLEASQMVYNQFKLGEAPVVRHGRPVLVAPGCHARLSNIAEDGTWKVDERFRTGGKWVLRQAGTSVGNIMKSWRELRDGGDAEQKKWFEEVEVMQQPAGYCDGVIVAWIQEMRML